MAIKLVNSQKTAAFEYDFAVDGGNVGTIIFPFTFGDNTFIQSLMIGSTNLTSAGFTLLTFGTDNVADQFLTNLPWQTISNSMIIYPDLNNQFAGLDDEKLMMTISADNLTGGQIFIIITYNELRP